MTLDFVFNRFPPSTNSLFLSFRRRGTNKIVRVKTNDYKDWIKHVEIECLKRGDRAELEQLTSKPYKLTINLYDVSWRTKKGTARKWDAANRIKALEDAICGFYGWKDEYCVETTVRKMKGHYEGVHAVFEFLDDSNLE